MNTPERSRLVARAEPFTAEQLARLESIEARVPVDIAADVAEEQVAAALFAAKQAYDGDFYVVAWENNYARDEWYELARAALAAMPPADEALRERVEAVASWCEGQAASRAHFAKVDPAYRVTLLPYEATAERLRDALGGTS